MKKKIGNIVIEIAKHSTPIELQIHALHNGYLINDKYYRTFNEAWVETKKELDKEFNYIEG